MLYSDPGRVDLDQILRETDDDDDYEVEDIVSRLELLMMDYNNDNSSLSSSAVPFLLLLDKILRRIIPRKPFVLGEKEKCKNLLWSTYSVDRIGLFVGWYYGRTNTDHECMLWRPTNAFHSS